MDSAVQLWPSYSYAVVTPATVALLRIHDGPEYVYAFCTPPTFMPVRRFRRS